MMKTTGRSKGGWWKSPRAELIRDATGAREGDLVLIENIMRDEIFHSTLDWQSQEELSEAARQAFARLNCDRELYEAVRAAALGVFEEMSNKY